MVGPSGGQGIGQSGHMCGLPLPPTLTDKQASWVLPCYSVRTEAKGAVVPEPGSAVLQPLVPRAAEGGSLCTGKRPHCHAGTARRGCLNTGCVLETREFL